MVDLIKKGVIDNSRKTIDRGKTVAAFCMGMKETYDTSTTTRSSSSSASTTPTIPLVIAQNSNMTAINAALQIDLTGQATAESIGNQFFSGIGGSADFMRGAILSPGGKTILVLQSTARNGEVSRIVPFLDPGTGVTLNRGDIHYVVTEYGIAYIHGKNIRERAMDLIAIAHPKFRPWLIEEAKRLNLIYKDQAFIPGKRGEYPEHLETIPDDPAGDRAEDAAGEDQRRDPDQGPLLLPFRPEPPAPLHVDAPGHAPREAAGVRGHRLHQGDGASWRSSMNAEQGDRWPAWAR